MGIGNIVPAGIEKMNKQGKFGCISFAGYQGCINVKCVLTVFCLTF